MLYYKWPCDSLLVYPQHVDRKSAMFWKKLKIHISVESDNYSIVYHAFWLFGFLWQNILSVCHTNSLSTSIYLSKIIVVHMIFFTDPVNSMYVRWKSYRMRQYAIVYLEFVIWFHILKLHQWVLVLLNRFVWSNRSREVVSLFWILLNWLWETNL